MPEIFRINNLLSALATFNDATYWIIFAFAFLEALPIIGIFISGMLIIVFGGILINYGLASPMVVFIFAFLGTFFGGLSSFALGRISGSKQIFPTHSLIAPFALSLQLRHGVFSLLGRFIGPIAGFLYFTLGITPIHKRKFFIWHVFGSLIYVVILLFAGYYFTQLIIQIANISGLLSIALSLIISSIILITLMVNAIRLALPMLKNFLIIAQIHFIKNPRVQKWLKKYPQTTKWIETRMHSNDFTGLWLTLFFLLVIYLFGLAIALSFNILHSHFVIGIDENLALLMRSLWNPYYINAMTFITNIANSKSIIFLAFGLLVFLAINRSWVFFFGLIISVLGDVLTVTVLKHLIARPRPTAMYYLETSYSFPSGHAGISVAFFGFFSYLLFRIFKISPIFSAIFGITMAFFIGVSRIYLVEHYLSDVLNGWAIGAFWLCLGIMTSEYLLTKAYTTTQKI